MRRIVLLVSLCLTIGMNSGKANEVAKVVYLKTFIEESQAVANVGYALRNALAYCKEQNASKLVLTGGVLEIDDLYLSERYLWISNNDEGLKRIAFDLTDMHDFEIDGNGSTLLFSGFISPFNLLHSKNITIKNLSVDYTRTFHSEGEIMAVGEDYMDLKFGPDYPYRIDHGRLIFHDDKNVIYPYSNLLEFDPIKKETAFKVKDYWISSHGSMPAEQLGNGAVRIFKENLTGTIGNVLVFGAANRKDPCFTVSDSEGVTLIDVNMYHAGGMGVIAQRSKDIELNGVHVVIAPGSNRVISITADATHFSNCGGYINLLNCTFENQKDDATNIHGIYAVVDKILSKNEVIFSLKHAQQQGFNFFKVGSEIEFVNHKTLANLGKGKVSEVSALNKQFIRVTLENEIPDLALSDVVASIDMYPDVTIRNCKMSGNRARGLLLGSRGKIIIEDNYFHVPGAAILFEGDGTYWFEQSGVRDVTIRNNTFDNCNYGVWGNACISVGTGISKENREFSRYHKNIVVEDNTFNVFDPRIINLYSVEGFTFRNNIVTKNSDYKNLYEGEEAIVITDSDQVSIQ